MTAPDYLLFVRVVPETYDPALSYWFCGSEGLGHLFKGDHHPGPSWSATSCVSYYQAVEVPVEREPVVLRKNVVVAGAKGLVGSIKVPAQEAIARRPPVQDALVDFLRRQGVSMPEHAAALIRSEGLL